jgi:hypothetical protein
MKPDSKKRLEEFVKRAEYIRRLSYFDGGENIIGFEIVGEHEINFHQPDNEKRDALLLNLRLFVQDKDDISLRRMAELYDDPNITDLWKQEHNKERAILKLKLCQLAVEGPKGSITYEDVFQMFLFGERAHYNQDDKAFKLYQEWVTDKTLWELLHNTFHETLIWVSRAIVNIGLASKEELQRFNASGTKMNRKSE